MDTKSLSRLPLNGFAVFAPDRQSRSVLNRLEVRLWRITDGLPGRFVVHRVLVTDLDAADNIGRGVAVTSEVAVIVRRIANPLGRPARRRRSRKAA